MSSRVIILLGWAASALAVTSCADPGTPRAMSIYAVRVVQGDAALVVTADVSCAEGSHVDVGEDSDVVNLLWLARVGDCAGSDDRGQLTEITVPLTAPLAERSVVDGRCAVLSPNEPCVIEVQR